MKVHLEVADQKANVKRVVLKSSTLIGRGQDCSLKIASSKVSRRHCLITLRDSQVLVRDLGSANGTFLNGKQIPPKKNVRVPPGTKLSIGPAEFVIRFDAPAPVKVPATENSTVEIPVVASASADIDTQEQTSPHEENPNQISDTVQHSADALHDTIAEEEYDTPAAGEPAVVPEDFSEDAEDNLAETAFFDPESIQQAMKEEAELKAADSAAEEKPALSTEDGLVVQEADELTLEESSEFKLGSSIDAAETSANKGRLSKFFGRFKKKEQQEPLESETEQLAPKTQSVQEPVADTVETFELEETTKEKTTEEVGSLSADSDSEEVEYEYYYEEEVDNDESLETGAPAEDDPGLSDFMNQFEK